MVPENLCTDVNKKKHVTSHIFQPSSSIIFTFEYSEANGRISME